jgi:pyridoxal phosphate enzyme (YggS family)
MAVTKTVSPENVNIAIENGVDLLGENRVQEYLSKKDFYRNAEVQFIGTLQSRKVPLIIPLIKTVQSVDSVKLAEKIARVSRDCNTCTDILLEINIGREDTKSGVMPEAVFETAKAVGEFQNIHLRGLMTIPPPVNSDIYFGQMQEIYLKLREDLGLDDFNILSMGMSGDYITAIKYGSTLVRIGSALFGARV